MLRLVKSTFYDEQNTRLKLAKFIKSADHLSFGPQCLKFEKNFSQYQERQHTILVNSGSSANLALIQALLNLGRLKPGDKVGFSAVTWSTNVMPLIQLGLVPIPIDVELDTLNISSKTLSNTLKTTQLKALFITHLLGLSHDLSKITDICQDQDIILIEDTCEALGSRHQDKLLGNFGLASTFSFYVAHHLSTIEGGAITTDDPELARELCIVRAHGWDRNLTTAQQSSLRKDHHINESFYSRYTFYDLGYNLRPTEITGFLGNTCLPQLEENVQVRQANFNAITTPLYADSRYLPITPKYLTTHSSFAIPILCRTQAIRRQCVKACQDTIEIRPIVGGLMTRQPFFKKYFLQIAKAHPCKNARLIHKKGFYFANHPELNPKDIKIIHTTLLTNAQR